MQSGSRAQHRPLLAFLRRPEIKTVANRTSLAASLRGASLRAVCANTAVQFKMEDTRLSRRIWAFSVSEAPLQHQERALGVKLRVLHVAETLRLLSVMFMVVKLHICAFIHERPRGCSGVLEVVISVYNLWTYSRTL